MIHGDIGRGYWCVERCYETRSFWDMQWSLATVWRRWRIAGKMLDRRLNVVLQSKLQEEEERFRQHRSFSDHNITFGIIIKQSTECNSSLYVNSINFWKGIWQCQQRQCTAYQINWSTSLYVSVNLWRFNMQSDPQTGARQGYILLCFLFLLVSD